MPRDRGSDENISLQISDFLLSQLGRYGGGKRGREIWDKITAV